MPPTTPVAGYRKLYSRDPVTGEVFEISASMPPTALDDLSDVTTGGPTGPVDGQALIWNGAMSQWVPGTASTVAALDDLTDVDTGTTPPISGDGLVWDGAMWVPVLPSLPGLSDVSDAMVPVNGDALIFDSTLGAWTSKVNVAVLPPGTANGQVLTWNGTAWVPQAPPTSGASTTANVGPNEAYAISSLPYNRGAAFSISVAMMSGAACQVASGIAMVREEAGVGYIGHIWLDQQASITAELLSKIGIARHNSDQAGFVLYVRSTGARTLIADITSRIGTLNAALPMEYTVPTSGIVEIDL